MRRFGMKLYSLYGQYVSREKARSVAKRLREQGNLARVVRASGFKFTGEYDVYKANK